MRTGRLCNPPRVQRQNPHFTVNNSNQPLSPPNATCIHFVRAKESSAEKINDLFSSPISPLLYLRSKHRRRRLCDRQCRSHRFVQSVIRAGPSCRFIRSCALETAPNPTIATLGFTGSSSDRDRAFRICKHLRGV